MDMTGSHSVPASQQETWVALNDPEMLRSCIAGCEKIELIGENQYEVAMSVRIGPVSAKFKGKMTLSDIEAPNSYRITFEGQGGVAGFAKGNAGVKLSPDGERTLLEYTAQAQVGGKLAQLGSRLIDSSAKKMAADFFDKFAALFQEQPATDASGAA